MAILTGRNGQVLWDAAAGSPTSATLIASLNSFKLSLKTDYEDVSCFGDTNRVYVPGLRDISGTIGGFWNSADRTLIAASEQSTPGFLELVPNSTESQYMFRGLAYMDADIDCSLSAPKLSGNFRAAGAWVIPGL